MEGSLLNLDCCVHLFKYVTLQELLKHRLICRSWNDEICDILRKKQTLKVFENPSIVTEYMNWNFYEEREAFPFLRFSEHTEDDDVVFLNPNLVISSFVSFLSTRMPNITKFLLLVNNIKVWESIDLILDALPNMQTFFISGSKHKHISYQKTLKKIYETLRKRQIRLKELFLYPNCFPFVEGYGGQIYLDDMLQVSRSLYVDVSEQLQDLTPKPSIQELFIGRWDDQTLSLNTFPNLEVLRVYTPIKHCLVDDMDPQHLPNLKHLHSYMWFSLDPSHMRKLNALPKLEQFSCPGLDVDEEFLSSNTCRGHINETVSHLQITSRMTENDFSIFFANLSTILKVFSALSLLTIYGLNEKQRQSIRDFVPGRIDAKFVEFDSERFMGRFRSGIDIL